MLRVALTGGIGCGKTTVAAHFRDLGIPCFVADDAGASYYDDVAFCRQVADLLGDHILKPDGHVSKRAIADTIFADSNKKDSLNALVHPRVMHDFEQWCRQQHDVPYVLFECAILYEHGLENLVDAVVAVYVDLSERLQRLQVRDNATREQLTPFVEAQLPAEDKMMRADWVVLNYEGNPRQRQVQYIHQQLCLMAKAKNR